MKSLDEVEAELYDARCDWEQLASDLQDPDLEVQWESDDVVFIRTKVETLEWVLDSDDSSY